MTAQWAASAGPPQERRGAVRSPGRWPKWAVGVVAAMAAAFGVGFGLTASGGAGPRSRASSPATTGPTTTSPPGPSDPASAALPALDVQQSDVGPALSVALIPGGNRVAGEITLDLCNASYPSEALRTARLQVDVADAQGNVVLSTEAVLYRSAAATSQAFAELRSAASHCPATPVASPVGEPTVTTHFNAAPDSAWPPVAGVQRLAFDFVATDQSGQSQHGVAVFLRRGRVLLGIYFQSPDGPQPSVAGQATIPGIVNLLAGRLNRLPATATG